MNYEENHQIQSISISMGLYQFAILLAFITHIFTGWIRELDNVVKVILNDKSSDLSWCPIIHKNLRSKIVTDILRLNVKHQALSGVHFRFRLSEPYRLQKSIRNVTFINLWREIINYQIRLRVSLSYTGCRKKYE